MICNNYIPYKIKLEIEKQLFYCEETLIEIENIDVNLKSLIYLKMVYKNDKTTDN